MSAEASPSGILLADKPVGLTSHDMVARARRALGTRRVGHAGTLDPFATGLLILLVGRATRLASHLAPLPKTYEAVVAAGGHLEHRRPRGGDRRDRRRARAARCCRSARSASARRRYSAVRIDGERAYARARRGEAVETAEREVTVFESSVLWREGDRAALRFVCSSGTYVRSLVADLGDAYCLELRRLAIGPFEAAGAWPGEGAATLEPIAAAWARFGATATLDGAEAAAAAHGRPLPPRGLAGAVLLLDPDGEAVAVAGERDGALRVEVGLRG